MSKVRPISGFPEWLPRERIVEQHFLDVIRETFELHVQHPAGERGAEADPEGARTGLRDGDPVAGSRDLEVDRTPDLVSGLRPATAGGARALARDDVGVLRVGSRAHLTVLEAPTHVHLAYRPGVPLVAEVIA